MLKSCLLSGYRAGITITLWEDLSNLIQPSLDRFIERFCGFRFAPKEETPVRRAKKLLPFQSFTVKDTDEVVGSEGAMVGR